MLAYAQPETKWPGGPPMRREDGSLVCAYCGLLFDPGHDRAIEGHVARHEEPTVGLSHRTLHYDGDGKLVSITLSSYEPGGDDDPWSDDGGED